MKRWILIGTLLAAAFTTAAGQNHIERAMRRAREEREALARKTVVSDEGTAGAGYLTYRVENGDTTYFDSIDPVWIWGRGKGPQSEKQWRKYYKTVWRFIPTPSPPDGSRKSWTAPSRPEIMGA